MRVEHQLTEMRSELTEIRSELTEMRSELTEMRSELTEIRSKLLHQSILSRLSVNEERKKIAEKMKNILDSKFDRFYLDCYNIMISIRTLHDGMPRQVRAAVVNEDLTITAMPDSISNKSFSEIEPALRYMLQCLKLNT